MVAPPGNEPQPRRDCGAPDRRIYRRSSSRRSSVRYGTDELWPLQNVQPSDPPRLIDRRGDRSPRSACLICHAGPNRLGLSNVFGWVVGVAGVSTTPCSTKAHRNRNGRTPDDEISSTADVRQRIRRLFAGLSRAHRAHRALVSTTAPDLDVAAPAVRAICSGSAGPAPHSRVV